MCYAAAHAPAQLTRDTGGPSSRYQLRRFGTGRPVQAQPHEAFALGYVVTRTVEVVLLLPAAVGPLLLLAVSSPQSTAAPAEPTQFRTLRTLLLSYVWRCGI